MPALRKRWCTAAVATGLLAAAPPAYADALGSVVDRLAATQDRSSGGYSSGRANAAVNHAYSAWAAMAVAAAGESPRRWRPAGIGLDAALTKIPKQASLSDVMRAAVAARAARTDPRQALPIDPVPTILGAQARDGTIGGSISTTAWAIFALRASGVGSRDPAIAAAAAAIERSQKGDGGWVALGQRRTDVITTSTAIQALVAARGRAADGGALPQARRYLQRALRRDGGFGVRRGRPSRAVSTAWGALAVAALGERSGVGRWRKGEVRVDISRGPFGGTGTSRRACSPTGTPLLSPEHGWRSPWLSGHCRSSRGDGLASYGMRRESSLAARRRAAESGALCSSSTATIGAAQASIPEGSGFGSAGGI